MDPRLLKYYERELHYVRGMGAEFAKEHPKIAGRLGMRGTEVADPYVQQLLEGFAFLAARVQLKMDAEFPRFTQHLLELVYPHYLAPLPSMGIAQFFPVLGESALAEGFILPRHTTLRTTLGKGDKTSCEYRTGQDATFWPIEVTDAKYYATAGALQTAGIERLGGVRAGIRLSLRASGGLAFDQLKLDTLRFFLKGADTLPGRIYEQLLGNRCGVVVRQKGGSAPWKAHLPGSSIRPVGFDSEQGLVPYVRRSFEGYRYLQEYFAFPQRFLFADFTGLAPALSRCTGTELEIVILLDRRDPELEDVLDKDHFALHCVPIVNLFPKRADRIHLDSREHEYHVVADRTRPMDFEIWSVEAVQGFGASAEPQKTFRSLYSSRSQSDANDGAFFTTSRTARALSSRQHRKGARSSYVGSEVFLQLVDAAESPYPSDLKQLGVETICTNRDLPLDISFGHGRTDLTLDTSAPVEAIRFVAGPTSPKPSYADGDTTWRLISHLSLNYLSLIDTDELEGAQALRSLLGLYSPQHDAVSVKQLEGVKSVSSTAINGRIPAPGPISFGRGLEVTLTCDEGAFGGAGLFLFGQVMEMFFAKYVSINSFTETVLVSTERGEVMRWPARHGQIHTL